MILVKMLRILNIMSSIVEKLRFLSESYEIYQNVMIHHSEKLQILFLKS